MVFAKRKPEPAPAPAPAPKPDLAGAILRLRGEIEAFIDAKTMELKRSRDGQAQPYESLRAMLTRNDDCICRVAMNLLANE